MSLIEEIDSSGLFNERIHTAYHNQVSFYWTLTGTNYMFSVYNFPHNWMCIWYSDVKASERTSFEDVLLNVSEDIQIKLLFNLDLFNKHDPKD